jgi:hypothetical protein
MVSHERLLTGMIKEEWRTKILVANDLIINTMIEANMPLPKFSKKVLTREGKYPKLISSCEGRNFLSIIWAKIFD